MRYYSVGANVHASDELYLALKKVDPSPTFETKDRYPGGPQFRDRPIKFYIDEVNLTMLRLQHDIPEDSILYIRGEREVL